MPDRELYAVPLPAAGTTRAGARTSQQQALQAILGSDSGSVEPIASDPGEQTLSVEYADTYAEVRAQELKELATGYSQPLPYHAIGTTSPDDRYVTVRNADVGPVDPRSRKFQRVTVTLSEAGTIASDWREVATAPAQVDHPFGNTTEAPVGIPAAATKVRWFNPETQATADPTVQTTRSSRLGDVDILDATAAPYDQPSVIFELDYAREGETDPRIFDDRGNADILDGNGAVQWQKVFAASHQFEGSPVVTNGLLRLTIDETASPGITAERWDDANSQWDSQSLGSSSWSLFDWDIRIIGLAQVGGVAEFVDPTQSPTAYHTLTWQLARGATDVLWATTSAIPSGLVDLLDPIAADHIYDAYGDVRSSPQGLRAREEVSG